VAVFDLINAVLLRPLAMHRPDELARLVTVDHKLGPRSAFSYRTYEVVRAKSTCFTDVIGYALRGTTEWADSVASGRLWYEVVTSNYFYRAGIATASRPTANTGGQPERIRTLPGRPQPRVLAAPFQR
jgi:hypothetical protein